MKPFTEPATDQISLPGVMGAFADLDAHGIGERAHDAGEADLIGAGFGERLHCSIIIVPSTVSCYLLASSIVVE